MHRELRWYWRDHDFPRLGAARAAASSSATTARCSTATSTSFDARGRELVVDGRHVAVADRARAARRACPAVGVVHDEWMIYGPRVDAWSRALSPPAPAGARSRSALTGVPAALDLGARRRWVFVSEAPMRARAPPAAAPGRAASSTPASTRTLFRPAPAHAVGVAAALRRPDRPAQGHRHRDPARLPALDGATPRSSCGGGDDEHLRGAAASSPSELGRRDRVRFERRARRDLPAPYAEADARAVPGALGGAVGARAARGDGRRARRWSATGTRRLGRVPARRRELPPVPPARRPGARSPPRVERLAGDPALARGCARAGSTTAARYDQAGVRRRAVVEAVGARGGAMSAPVTVAVVSWNTRELLERCLRSLAPDADAGLAEVWVVDNASSDGSADLVRDALPLGRAGGRAREPRLRARGQRGGAAHARAPGSRLERRRRARARRARGAARGRRRDPRAGALAPRLVQPDGSTQHSVHRFPTVAVSLALNHGLHALVPGLGDRLLPRGPLGPEPPARRGLGARRVPPRSGGPPSTRPAASTSASGCTRRTSTSPGGCDTAGWRTRYEPGAVVHHAVAAATAPAFGGGREARHMEAAYSWMARRRGLPATRAYAAVNLAAAAARLAVLRPLAVAWPGRFRVGRDRAARFAEAAPHRPAAAPEAPAAGVRGGRGVRAYTRPTARGGPRCFRT